MLENIYKETETILNKLKRTDSITTKDVWYKTVINNAVWYTDSEREAGSNSVFIGRYVTVLIPFSDNYLPYRDWKKPGNPDGHYTMSIGDYIVKGIVDDDITAENIVKTLQGYGEDVCLVKYHNEVHDRFGATVQLKVQGV
jgi:hypothetical protein